MRSCFKEDLPTKNFTEFYTSTTLSAIAPFGEYLLDELGNFLTFGGTLSHQ